jgi:hypothetical protein
VSGIGDALKAIRQAILLEERRSEPIVPASCSGLLYALEGRMEGFLAAASAFGSGARRPAKLIEAAPKERSSIPPAQDT